MALALQASLHALHAPFLAVLSAVPLAHSPGVNGPALAPTTAPNDGPIRFRSLRTDVRIAEGVATTRAVILLQNLGSRPEEVHWILPLGEGAVADDFRMRSGGVDLVGEVLDAQRAQGIYEQIVRSRKDPALLEHFGRGCLRARIFPVPPQSPVEVEVSWREILPEVGGMRRWTFPLAAASIGSAQPERVALDLTIESTRALLNVVASPASAYSAAAAGTSAVAVASASSTVTSRSARALISCARWLPCARNSAASR